MPHELTPEQAREVDAMRASFPFRIVYYAIRGEEFRVDAVVTMHRPKRLAREGWSVYRVAR